MPCWAPPLELCSSVIVCGVDQSPPERRMASSTWLGQQAPTPTKWRQTTIASPSGSTATSGQIKSPSLPATRATMSPTDHSPPAAAVAQLTLVGVVQAAIASPRGVIATLVGDHPTNSSVGNDTGTDHVPPAGRVAASGTMRWLNAATASPRALIAIDGLIPWPSSWGADHA